MWFLWLAGFVLEDTWGRWLYSAFYLIAGVAALQFYAWTNPGSITPTLGASGAVAALMGAFLVRFPKMKIEMAWLFFLRIRTFKAPAWCLLPLWLLLMRVLELKLQRKPLLMLGLLLELLLLLLLWRLPWRSG